LSCRRCGARLIDREPPREGAQGRALHDDAHVHLRSRLGPHPLVRGSVGSEDARGHREMALGELRCRLDAARRRQRSRPSDQDRREGGARDQGSLPRRGRIAMIRGGTAAQATDWLSLAGAAEVWMGGLRQGKLPRYRSDIALLPVVKKSDFTEFAVLAAV